jgi:hypothetical protein
LSERYDGSSVFGANTLGFFPQFLLVDHQSGKLHENSKVLNYLKLRA